jgi:hypothetical protein
MLFKGWSIAVFSFSPTFISPCSLPFTALGSDAAVDPRVRHVEFLDCSLECGIGIWGNYVTYRRNYRLFRVDYPKSAIVSAHFRAPFSGT